MEISIDMHDGAIRKFDSKEVVMFTIGGRPIYNKNRSIKKIHKSVTYILSSGESYKEKLYKLSDIKNIFISEGAKIKLTYSRTDEVHCSKKYKSYKIRFADYTITRKDN